MPKLFDIVNKYPDNVAEGLPGEKLRELARECLDGYSRDLSSREGYERELDKAVELATQVKEEKNFPWTGAANVKYPLVTEGAMRFSAEAYPRLVDGFRPVKGRVIGEDPDGEKREAAKRVAKHMSWQVLEQMEEWEEDMDELLLLVAIIGTMFKKTYYDGERNRSDVVSPKNLVLNYHTRNLERAPRITHQLYFDENEVLEKQRAELWLDEDLGDNRAKVDEDGGATTDPEQTRKITGFEMPASGEDAPRLILEVHTWYDLDEDGYKEPWIITLDYSSEKVLRVVPRFSVDNVELDASEQVVKITPDSYFTKFSFIPNPDRSIYDLGLYHVVGAINEATNTLINQLIDAGTLSNLQSGFISKGLRIRGGNYNFRPGEWKSVNATLDDLNKGIFPLPVREPSNVLFQLLGVLIQSGQRLSSTQDALTGTSEQHNQKTGAAEQNVKQGMKVFNGIYKRLHRGLKREFKKLYALNAEYLDGAEYFTVLDSDPDMEAGDADSAQRVLESDYDPDAIDVIPASSPNIESEMEQMNKATALYQLAQEGFVNPQVAVKRILEAQDQPGIEELLEIPEAQPNFDQQIEMRKAELEEMKATADIQIRKLELHNDKIKAIASAIRDIAEAEGVEPGRQLEIYKAELQALKDEDDAEIRRRDAETKARQAMASQSRAAQRPNPSGGNS